MLLDEGLVAKANFLVVFVRSGVQRVLGSRCLSIRNTELKSVLITERSQCLNVYAISFLFSEYIRLFCYYQSHQQRIEFRCGLKTTIFFKNTKNFTCFFEGHSSDSVNEILHLQSAGWVVKTRIWVFVFGLKDVIFWGLLVDFGGICS